MGRRKEKLSASRHNKDLGSQAFARSFDNPFDWFKATQQSEGKVETKIGYVLFQHSSASLCSKSGRMFNLRYDGTVDQINRELQANPIRCDECDEILAHDPPVPAIEWRQKS
jgi:hypothetical protein